MSNFEDFVIWTACSLLFFSLKPFWIANRRLFIAAGILFFTPTVVIYESFMSYFSVWPLIICIPDYLFNISDNSALFINYVIPAASVCGLIFWGIAVWRKI